MLVAQERQDVGKSGVMESAKATVKASAKVFNFFSDSVYSNKFVAIVRELVANGVDSHIMAGKAKVPVEVWLPTLIDPVFKVRDHGIGMAHEFVMGPFMSYADGSTKDSSNDVIGGFGVGSKSPFAYTDQFTLKSIHGGVESIYSVFKGEDGVPEIALLSQRTTSDPNGVETSFPVEVGDFPSFEEAAFKALRYFDPLPNIVNSTSGKFEPVQYSSRGKTWGMRQSAGDLQIIMGGICYPVVASNLTYKFNNDIARKLLAFGLDIFVPIGTCSVALNREALAYDEKTIKNLEQVCLSVVDEVAASFSTMFDHHKTWWDARTALYKEVHPSNSTYHNVSIRGQFLADRALYKGQKLTYQFTLPILKGGMDIWDLERKNYRRSPAIPNPRWEHYEPNNGLPVSYNSKINRHDPVIQPGRYEFVIIDDLPRSPKSKSIAKIKEYVEGLAQDRNIFIIRPSDPGLWTGAKILTALGEPSNVEFTSNMPEPTKTVAQGGTVRPNVRMLTFDCQHQYDGYGRRFRYENIIPGATYGKKGVTEIDTKDQPDKGIVVTTESWKLPPDFYAKIDSGLIDPSELHFVTVGDRKKLSDKWIDFDDEFKKRLKAKLKAIPELGERLAVFNDMPESWRRMFNEKKRFNVPNKNNPLAKLQALYDQYVVPLDKVQHGLAPFVQIKLPQGAAPAKLVQQITERHTMAFRVLEMTRFSPSQLDCEIVVRVL